MYKKQALYTPEYQPTGDEVAVITTSKGTIRVQLAGKDAPIHVGNFVAVSYTHLDVYKRQARDPARRCRAKGVLRSLVHMPLLVRSAFAQASRLFKVPC